MAAKDLPALRPSGDGFRRRSFAAVVCALGLLPPAQDDSGGAFVILSRRKLAIDVEHGGEGPSRGRPSRDGFRRRSFAAVVCDPGLLPPAQDDSGGAFVILSRRKLAIDIEHGGEGPSRVRPSRDGFRRRSFAAVVCAPGFPPSGSG